MTTTAAKNIMRILRENADAKQAAQSASYLKTSDLEFLDAKLPGIHSAMRESTRGLEFRELEQTVSDL